MVSRSSPATVATSLVVVLLCVASFASGSCLSYGHSCWGAHGKRSGEAPPPGPDTQWFISRLVPRQWQAKLLQDIPDEQRRPPGLNMGDTSVLLPADSNLSDDVLGSDDKQVIIMEQPPRLYKILNHVTSKMDRK